jgi:hypothetical protein
MMGICDQPISPLENKNKKSSFAQSQYIYIVVSYFWAGLGLKRQRISDNVMCYLGDILRNTLRTQGTYWEPHGSLMGTHWELEGNTLGTKEK